MALTLPLHAAASMQRCCCSSAGTSTVTSPVIEIIVNRASLFDVIKWQQVSRSFKEAAQKRLNSYTAIDVKVYSGLRLLRQKARADDYDWHPSLTLMVIDLEPNHLGVAIDSEMKPRDVTALLHLLFSLRRKVEQLVIDSPIIELLVAQINKEQINMLIEILCHSRKLCQGYKTNVQWSLTPINLTRLPGGPFFPNLKKLSISSKTSQLQHLSRLLGYAVSVNLLYHVERIDLLCLQLIVGSAWQRPRQHHLFRQLTKFRQWTEANLLGERYFQQFRITKHKRNRSFSSCSNYSK